MSNWTKNLSKEKVDILNDTIMLVLRISDNLCIIYVTINSHYILYVFCKCPSLTYMLVDQHFKIFIKCYFMFSNIINHIHNAHITLLPITILPRHAECEFNNQTRKPKSFIKSSNFTMLTMLNAQNSGKNTKFSSNQIFPTNEKVCCKPISN